MITHMLDGSAELSLPADAETMTNLVRRSLDRHHRSRIPPSIPERVASFDISDPPASDVRCSTLGLDPTLGDDHIRNRRTGNEVATRGHPARDLENVEVPADGPPLSTLGLRLRCVTDNHALYRSPDSPILARVTKETVGPASDLILETEVEQDGEISLYNPATEQVTVLNGTASDIWRLLDGEHSIEEIVDLLTSAYQGDREEIARDVAEMVNLFSESRLLADE